MTEYSSGQGAVKETLAVGSVPGQIRHPHIARTSPALIDSWYALLKLHLSFFLCLLAFFPNLVKFVPVL